MRILPFVIGTWIIRRILENMSGPRIEATVGKDLQTYSRRFDLWERWEETIALAKIRPRQQEIVRASTLSDHRQHRLTGDWKTYLLTKGSRIRQNHWRFGRCSRGVCYSWGRANSYGGLWKTTRTFWEIQTTCCPFPDADKSVRRTT